MIEAEGHVIAPANHGVEFKGGRRVAGAMLRWKTGPLIVALTGLPFTLYFTWALSTLLASALTATDQLSAGISMAFVWVMAPGVVALWLVVLLALVTAHRAVPGSDPFDAPPS